MVTVDSPDTSRGSVFVAAAATAGWAAVVSFAPVLASVLLLWQFSGTDTSAGNAVRFSLTTWLLAHGIPVGTAQGTISLAPLTLTVLIVWRLVRAGAHTARAVGRVPHVLPMTVGAVMVCYAAVACVAALVAGTSYWQISPLRAFLTAGLLAGLASLPGALTEHGDDRRLWRRLPPAVRTGLWTGVYAGVLVVAAGAVLAAVATVSRYSQVIEIYRAYDAGAVGIIGLTMICLMYAPTMAIWGASYLTGPGFAFGVGTRIDVFDVVVGPLPAVPSLGALPAGPVAAAVGLLVGFPLVAGMVAGVLTARWNPDLPSGVLLGGGLLSLPTAGVLLAAVAFLARGALGDGRLSEIGPHPLWMGLVGAGLISAGGVIGALATRGLARRG